MSRRSVQRTLAALAFAAAAACYGMGLAGRTGSGSWLATTLASLALLTAGFYLASAPPDAPPRPLADPR